MRKLEPIDHVSFATGAAAADVAHALGGAVVGQAMADAVRASAAREMRGRLEEWARQRGFVNEGSELARDVDGVHVRVPIFRVGESIAHVTANALAPIAARVTVAPRRFWDRMLRRGKATGDDAFDARWFVDAPEVALAGAVVDPDVREALRDGVGWMRATYDEGRIEVIVDADPMCGARILEAVDVAVAVARARFSSSAYR